MSYDSTLSYVPSPQQMFPPPTKDPQAFCCCCLLLPLFCNPLSLNKITLMAWVYHSPLARGYLASGSATED